MVFEGTCYLTPILGAYLADAAWGRYKTILAFSGVRAREREGGAPRRARARVTPRLDRPCPSPLQVYFLGMAAIAASTVIPGLAPTPGTRRTASLAQNLGFFIPLYIVALGTGGIKPNVSAFGADQFDESDPADKR